MGADPGRSADPLVQSFRGDPSDDSSSDSDFDYRRKDRKSLLPPPRKVLQSYTRHRHRNSHSLTDSEDSDIEVSRFDLKFKVTISEFTKNRL